MRWPRRRWWRPILLLLACPGYTAAGAAGDMLRYQPAHPVSALSADGGRIIARLETPKGPEFFKLLLSGGKVHLSLLPGYRQPAVARRDDILPDGVVSRGQRDIDAAWLTGPTRRYDHGVLGDAIEASGVRVQMRDGRILSFTLPMDSVFEDRRVRLVDLDGDGGDELLVVRSYLAAGAALAVLRPGSDALAVVAETAPIGLPHRWLNPAAVADFDGDGRLEAALVVTPHIGGILKLFELRKSGLGSERLAEEWSAPGFSNHAMGSPIQAMAALVNWGKGWGRGPVLHLPNARRTGLRQVFFTDGGYRIRDLPRHERHIVTSLIAADLDADGWKEVVYGLDNGELMIQRRPSTGKEP